MKWLGLDPPYLKNKVKKIVVKIGIIGAWQPASEIFRNPFLRF